MATTDTDTDTDINIDIDALLERYLHLLDQYTTLRSKLTQLQSSLHHHLARAHFTTSHGIRYDSSSYDARMRASRRLSLSLSLSATNPPVPTFALAPDHKEDRDGDDAAARPSDPLRWFGILAPSELRAAQGDAATMMELVPRLVGVDAEMRAVEVEIRRARKRGAKAGRRRKGIEGENGIEGKKGVI